MEPSAAGRWSWKRKLVLQLALVPLLLAAVELGARVAFSWDAEAARAELMKLVGSMNAQVPDPYETDEELEVDLEALDQKLLLHPYYGWDKKSSLDDLARSVKHFRESADDDFDILVLGGSVAARFARHGEERLAELLRADARFAEREVRFHNFARGGFKQPQQAAELAYLFALGLEPDAVINIDGFNEIALSIRNEELGMHPLYPSSAFWSHFAKGREVDPEALDLQLTTWSLQREAHRVARGAIEGVQLESALLGSLALKKVRRLRVEWAVAQQAYTNHVSGRAGEAVVHGPSYAPGTESMLAITARNWVESSRSMRALCAERGALYLHVLQPTLADANSKPPSADEEDYLRSLREDLAAIRAGYDRLRQSGVELERAGVHFVDATDLFADIEETRYVDHCHFGPKGNRQLAERIVAAFLAAL
jgi:hypothetical protein